MIFSTQRPPREWTKIYYVTNENAINSSNKNWILHLALDSATVSIFFFNIPNCNMGLDNSAYYRILKAHEWNPLSYKEIADSLMKNGVKEMYHVNEDDIQFLFSIPNLEIFWCCRCHLVAKDGSTAHEHLHALVQYQKGTHLALKKRMQRPNKDSIPKQHLNQ